MKKNIIVTIALAAGLLSSCGQLDEHYIDESNANIMTMTVNVALVSDPSSFYDCVVDKDALTVVAQIPYYLSDVEPVMADVSKVRLQGTLPIGCRMEPGLGGVYNLAEGFTQTLIYPTSGKKEVYTFSAAFVKSSAAQLLSCTLTDQTVYASITVGQPSKSGDKGVIRVLKTADNESYLNSANIRISPWASVECEAYDPATGVLDLSAEKPVTVIAQDGVTKTVYDIDITLDLPSTVEYGLGQIEALWGFQATPGNPYGLMNNSANRTMAAIGNYLIVSNSVDFNHMLVYNRMTGQFIGDDLINTEGIDAGRSIHAICTDDAGHLFAAAFTSSKDSDSSNDAVRAWAWLDGIDKKPTSYIWRGLYNYGLGASELYRTVRVKGDLTDIAYIFSPSTGGSIVMEAYKATKNENGTYSAAQTSCIKIPAILGSLWRGAAVAPVAGDPDSPTLFYNSGNNRGIISYISGGATTQFNTPTEHFWPIGENDYSKNTVGIDYADINGARILAVGNGTYCGRQSAAGVNQFYYRVYVADVTTTPKESSLVDGFIFDTREGNDAGTNGIVGTGYSVTGMLSPFDYSNSTYIGDDDDQIVSILMVPGTDGLSVQMYILGMNRGLICYNLTSYDI